MCVFVTYCVLAVLALELKGRNAWQLKETTFYVDDFGTPLQGRTLTLKCYLFGPLGIYPSSYIWFKDGKVIPGETGENIILHNLKKEDAGEYLCGEPNSDIPRLAKQLDVLTHLPTPVVFKDRVPVDGQPFSLNCIIMEGYKVTPDTVYTWYRDSIEIKDQSGPVLVFNTLTEADSGKYTCTARDGPIDTTSARSMYLDVTPLVAPQVRIKEANAMSPLKGILGDNLTLICEVIHAYPMVPYYGYSWSFLHSNHGPMLPLVGNRRTLTMGPLTRKDSGQYFCQAKNDQNYETVTLAGQAFVTVEVVYLENISSTPDLDINENDPVILTCSVDSHPTAHITWTVDGKEVRWVVDNLDHYFIPRAACTDSANYTCHATNVNIPGHERTATTELLVNCDKGSKGGIHGSKITQAGISAQFDFILPELTSVLVVHPNGQVIITVHHNCAFVVSSLFMSRCLHPHCNPDSHHLTFTLTQVTDKDEGYYFCLEEKQRKPLPHCNQTLIQKRQVFDDSQPQHIAWLVGGIVTVLFICIITVLIIMLRRKYRTVLTVLRRSSISEMIPLINSASPLATRTHIQANERHDIFGKLYKKGKVFICPKLVPPEQERADKKDTGESASFPSQSPETHAEEENTTFLVKDMLRYTLEQSSHGDDLPSFILHNTRLSRKEDVILVLSKKLGVVVMIAKAFGDGFQTESLEMLVNCLMDAKNAVMEKLKGLVKPGTITAAIALFNSTETEPKHLREKLKILQSNPDVELLLGKTKKDFREWADRLSSRPDSQVWNWSTSGEDNSDKVFEMVARRFLNLASSYYPMESPKCLTDAESWLLTPEQMEVRDSTAKLLHIWGSLGSGKTTLLIHRARQWLTDGKVVVIAVGKEIYDVLLSHIADAVRREQTIDTLSRLRVCRTDKAMQRAVTELRGLFPGVEVCIAVDTLRDTDMFKCMLHTVESQQASSVWSVCRENIPAIDKELSETAHKLGWESAKIPCCIRCPENTVELLNLLVEGCSVYDSFTSCSILCSNDINNWGVLDHSSHQDYATILSSCVTCKEELEENLPSEGRHLDWADWIALHTGDPNVHTDVKDLRTTLQNLGVQTSHDDYDDIAASHGSRLDASDTDLCSWIKRVDKGEDQRGNRTVHLVRVRDFIGLEKGNVLLVHWDERDTNPNHQSQTERHQRLGEHRRQWIQALSRSKGQVILLLLTPSPARSLLNLPEAVIRAF